MSLSNDRKLNVEKSISVVLLCSHNFMLFSLKVILSKLSNEKD